MVVFPLPKCGGKKLAPVPTITNICYKISHSPTKFEAIALKFGKLNTESDVRNNLNVALRRA